MTFWAEISKGLSMCVLDEITNGCIVNEFMFPCVPDGSVDKHVYHER